MLFVVSGRLYLMEENQHLYNRRKFNSLFCPRTKFIKDINCVISETKILLAAYGLRRLLL